ncbi:hypothetical protein ACGF5C_31285 [Micromonospora sp. NPDC047620]|uniref:hypothetical protein n=1 Tax=Micromonospora sp. NPDC047620 TaxID=3364251 RepID=UPI003717B4B0
MAFVGVNRFVRCCLTAVAASSLLSAAACSPEVESPWKRLGKPVGGNVEDIAWRADGTIFGLHRTASEDEPKLVEFTSETEMPREVALAPVGFCPQPAFVDLSILPDGRLGAVVTCEGGGTYSRDERVSVAIEDGKLIELATLGGPDRLITWNADFETGWLEVLTGRCRSIARFVDGKALPFPRYRPANVVTWDLGRDALEGSSCAARGRAGFVAVGNVNELYFLASDEAETSLGDPSGPRWSLLVYQPESEHLREIGPEFIDPYDQVAVVQRGSVLVSGVVNGKRGLWQVTVSDGQASLVSSGSYGAIAVAIDGQRAAVVHSTGKEQEVVEVGLPSVR